MMSERMDRDVQTGDATDGWVADAASDFFDDLENIDPSAPVKTRYHMLEAVLVQAVNQKVKAVSIKFSGIFAKIDYLIKEYQIRKKDKSLSFGINDVRVRLKEVDITPEENLLSSFGIDLKAVCRFISMVYDVPVPPSLESRFPLTEYRHFRQRLKDADGHDVKALRCVIDSWDDQYITATREDTGEVTRINYAFKDKYSMGDWSYLKDWLMKNEMINVVKPREEAGVLYPELLVFAPDYLINVTTIAQCYDSQDVSPLVSLIEKIKPNAITSPILLGNFASQLLDEVAYGTDIPYTDSIRSFFRSNALGFVACCDLKPDFHKNAQLQKCHIQHAMTTTYRQKVNRDFRSDEVILEPSFFSPVLGLQGRMDFLNLNYKVVIEQKSGKGAFVPGCPPQQLAGVQDKHLVQLLLYRALLHYDYKQLDYSELYSFLLYSKYEEGLVDVTSMPKMLFDAIRLRNEIAWCELAYARGGMEVLDELTPESLYPHAAGKLWTDYTRPQLEALLAPIHQASPLERAYYFRMLRFIANEQLLSKLGNKTKENAGFAATWNSTVEEKRQAGNIYERLSLHVDSADKAIEEVRFSFSQGVDVDMSNFRVGDIVFFYPYDDGQIPDATATMVFRGTLVDITSDHISVHLRNPQTSRIVFDYYQGAVWAIEHDFMESSYSALYRGMHAFLSATPRRRALLLHQCEPEVDTGVKLLGDYSCGGRTEFNDIVLHAKQAKDLYLIIGPPGTGKTSYGMRNLLEEYLREEGTSVLLLSYTNRAVDEICSKLVEMDGGRLDFIRLGHNFSCEERYRKYLFGNKAAECRNLDEIRQMISRTRVFCATTTTLNANIALLQLKQFDLAIIDEASQILEPHILGLLSARYGDADAIRKFVLIGDEKQLPAVVQQTEDESEVTDPALREIGLKNCRLSLFERLLHLYGYRDGKIDERCCHMLTRQGRMHPDIARFPNYAFYQNALRPVPLEHQQEPTPSRGPEHNGIEDLLVSRRIAFLSCKADRRADESDKVNTAEARMIAALVKAEHDRLGADFDAKQSVGVIVPYRNQISTVRHAIARYGVDHLDSITIDTVERYQGSQRDVIIYSFTAKKYYQLGFLTSNEYIDETDGSVIDRKLNVAMTRARKNLVLIGDGDLLVHDITFYKLIEYVKSKQSYFEIPADAFVSGRFVLPDVSPVENEAFSKAVPAISRSFERVFRLLVDQPVRQDPRTRWPVLILGNTMDVNLDLIGYGRTSFVQERTLFADGSFRQVSPDDQVLLYCYYLMRRYEAQATALLADHHRQMDGLMRSCEGRVHIIDFGCGPATMGIALADSFGPLLDGATYVGIDTSRPMQAMARRMMEATGRDIRVMTEESFAALSEVFWKSRSEVSSLFVFTFSYYFACVTPAVAERLARQIVEVMARHPLNRYIFVVQQAPSDARLRSFQAFMSVLRTSGEHIEILS